MQAQSDPSSPAAGGGPAAGRPRTTLQKAVETGLCVITWTALGLYLEIYGPTLIDLKLKLGADYEAVTAGVAGRSVGLFPGSVIGGVLVDRFGGYCHLMIAVCLVIAGGVTVPVPLVPNVDFLWPLCFLGGLVESVINVAGQRIILNIWKEKSAAPMILLHGGYGIGSLLVPLYSNPFLAVEKPKPEPNLSENMSSILNYTTTEKSEETEYSEESRIQYSYLISAVPVVLLSLAFFAYQVREIRYMRERKQASVAALDMSKTTIESQEIRTQRSIREMIDPASCAGGRRCYAIQIWILILFYFANAGGGERMIAGFVRTYSVDQLDFEKSDASFVNTTFWISFTLGRFFFFLMARWISIRILILVESGAVLIIAILMNFFAFTSVTAYWVLVQPLGFFLAPMWPSGVSWADFHIELTGLGMMVVLLGGSVGGTAHMRLIGYLYEHKGTRMFLYQMIGYGALAFALSVALDLVGAQHGNRFKGEKDRDEALTLSQKTSNVPELENNQHTANTVEKQ